MKNLLIIYPHWPPSNLTGVHRPRLIANYIHEFGWHPIVLTVKPEYYEEPLDYDMLKTVSDKVEVISVRAWRVPKPRIFGDIGIRGFKFLYHRALEIIENRQIAFVWIPIPSFYTSLIGRLLYEKTGVKYSIDYIDPWVRDISGRRNLRAYLSNQVAKILEPIALKKVSLVTGVAEKYYLSALKRSFKENSYPATLAFPYGFDPNDHKLTPSRLDLPWAGCDCKPLIYAGAFLPNSKYFFEVLFKVLSENKPLLTGYKMFFIGSGSYSLSEMAKRFGIEEFIVEINKRYPYLQILQILAKSHGVMVIGSTEQHYTASKIFQSLLSERPVFAIFHYQSTTVQILEQANATNFLVRYNPDLSSKEFEKQVIGRFREFLQGADWQPNLSVLEKYSARENARIFANKLNELVHN